RAGGQVGLDAVAQAAVVLARDVDAEDLPMAAEAAGVPRLAKQAKAQGIAFVVETAPAPGFKGRGGIRQPVLVAVLPDFGVLVVELRLQRLQPAPAGLPFAGDARAQALLAVVGVEPVGGGVAAAAEAQRIDRGLARLAGPVQGDDMATR